ncbi:MAG TPA: hypothetical protein VKE40_18760 [Gemmataceae bacterium]|nr:hypothetical protein [Gemmataceae bacterium]
MKRTAAAFVLLAGLGGGCTSTPDKMSELNQFGKAMKPADAPMLVGPHGQPVVPAAYTRGPKDEGIVRADGRNLPNGGVVQASGTGMGPIGHKAQGGPVATGEDGVPGFYPGQGILPVPYQGPWGAVAAVGGLPPMGLAAPINARTSVRFAEPIDMQITWYGLGGLVDKPLITPARYNFAQGGIYRLKLSNIAGHAGIDLYPTLEVVPATAKTATYLAHSSVPVSFTDEDFEQVLAGNFLVKVIYLPDPVYQDLAAVAGPAEVISTRLEPGVDPIAEARRRGEILLIIRMGNIDLEKAAPPLDAPTPFGGPPRVVPVPPAARPDARGPGPVPPGVASDLFGPGPMGTPRPMPPTRLP